MCLPCAAGTPAGVRLVQRPVRELCRRRTCHEPALAMSEQRQQRRGQLLAHFGERARQFGTFAKQGLYRFIRFLESRYPKAIPKLIAAFPSASRRTGFVHS